MSSYFTQARRGLLVLLALAPASVFAQPSFGAGSAPPQFALASATLPDAPLAQQAPASTPPTTGIDAKIDSIGKIKIGPRFDPKALNASDAGQPLSAKGKILLSVDEQTTVYAFTTAILAAGWEHAINGEPKYGTDSGGFGQQLGAAYIRQSSQSVFADGIFAAVLHEDPRFYRLGKGGFKRRVLYAASRTWRTRTDSGAPTINYSLLAGYGAAAALTMAYYPDVSATGSKAAQTYAWSLGSNMLGNQYHEFWPDVARTLFHRHR